MPANLPPQYFEAEKQFRTAKTPEEKIVALQTMLAIMPKHKGTDHLHAELRRRIAKLTEEAERKSATSRTSLYIKKEGAGQVVLIGLPNVGKSQLLAAITDATPEIAEYPFTTKTPNIGMMKFENIQVQLVDAPPITSHESRLWLNNVARNADLIAIIVDLSMNPIEEAEATIKELDSVGIVANTEGSREIIGKQRKRMLIVGNKNDLADANLHSHELIQKFNGKLPIISISAKEGTSLEEIKKTLFKSLGIIRVHTKSPGVKPHLNDPMVMKKGSTIKDAAEAVHKDFRAKLKYAVVWGSGKFDGQRASPEHVLQDNDIIELHI